MSNLVLQYNFEPEHQSTTTIDNVVYQTITNASYGSYTLDALNYGTQLVTSDRKFGTTSAYFDGTSGIALPAISNLGQNITITCWIKPGLNESATSGAICQFGTILSFDLQSDRGLVLTCNNSLSAPGYASSITVLPENKWSFISWSISSSEWILRVNDTCERYPGRNVFTGSIDANSSLGYGDNGLLRAYIDDFRIYRGALTVDQTYELYDRGTITHYYKFGVEDLALGNTASSATVANGFFTTLALNPNTYSLMDITSVANWTISYSMPPLFFLLYLVNQSGPWGYITPLPPNVTQWLSFQYLNQSGTYTISQSINFDVSGGYQLTYYSACRPGYPSGITITSSIAGVSMSDRINDTTSWHKYQSMFTITTPGSYTLTFQTSQETAPSNALYLTGITIAPFTQISNNAFGYPVTDTLANTATSANFKIDTSTYARGISSLYTASNNLISPPAINNVDASGITVSTWINPVVTSTLATGITNYYKLTNTSYNGTQLYNYASGTGVLDATMVNSPAFGTTSGKNELQFNSASAQRVQLPSYTIGNDGFTFACWFRAVSNTYYARLFDMTTYLNNNADSGEFSIYILYNALIFHYNTLAGSAIISNGMYQNIDVNDNTYRHLAITVSANKNNVCQINTYINGTLQHTYSNVAYFDQPTVARPYVNLGYKYLDTTTYFNGGMFDVVLLKRPITQTEVTHLYNNPNSSNILLPSFPTNVVIHSLNGGAYRWNVHARFTATNAYDLSFCMYSGANTTPLVTVSQSLTPVLNSNVTVNTVASPVASFSTSTWYHILWCITPNYWKIAINNKVSTLYQFAKLAEGTIQLVAMPTTITPSLLYDPSMSSTTIRYYQGNLDEFRLYNREITDDEIYKLYTYGTLRSGYYDANGNDLITQYSGGSTGTALTYYSETGDTLSNLFSAYSETPTPNTIQFYSVVYDVSRVVISSNAIGATTTASTSLVQVGQVMATAGVTDYPRVVSVDVPNNTVYINKSETVQTVKGQTAAAYTVVNGVLTCSAATSFTGTAPAVGDLVFHTAIPLGTYITNVSVGVLTNGMSSPNVANGYFVTPVVTTGTIVEKTSALTDIVNWTFTGVSANMKVYVANNATVPGTTFTAPVLPTAQQYLVFSDTGTAGTVTLSQSLTFVLGGNYTLGFNMAGLSNINASHTLTVSIAGTTSAAYTATAHTWTTRSLNFTVGSAGAYTLSFVSTNGGGSASGMCLGAISITQPVSTDPVVSTSPYTLTLSNKSVNISSPTETVKWYNTSIATFSTLTKKSATESGYKLYSATGYDDYVYKFGNVLLTNLPYVATGTFTSSVSNGYYLLAFTAGSGTVTFVDVSSVEVLVVGGGGAGGYGNSTLGGGGGEGGASVFNSTYFVKNAAVYNISVGNGGSAITNSSGECGQPSCFANMFAFGGNGGVYSTTATPSGGSGAGNGGDGGMGGISPTGTVGTSGVEYTVGGGSLTAYGGGGGGGILSGTITTGGSGGGGNGGNDTTAGSAGSANTGGGGGGGGSSAGVASGAGGRGVVLIYVGAPPDALRALVVSEKTSTTATVSFTPPRRPVAGYTLSAYSGELLINSVAFGGSATSGVINGLTANTMYTFTLVAYNALGTSSISVTGSTLPLINAPSAITLGTVGTSTATIQITNTDQTPSAYYVVLTATGYTSPTYYTTNNVVRAYGLSANTTYTVTATAVSVSQIPSATSGTTTFTTTVGILLDPVIRLSVSNTDTTSTYSFTKPAQTITSYSLYRDNLTGNYNTDKLVGVYRATPGNAYSWNNSMYSGDAVSDASVIGSSSIPTFTPGASNYNVTLTATSSQYIKLPTIDLSNNGFSVACYMKAASTAPTSATLFCFGQYDGSQNYVVRIYLNASGYLSYNMFNAAGTTSTGGDIVINASSIKDNTFRHFAWTLSPISGSTCTVTGYINGTQVYQASNISYPVRGVTRASCYVGESSIAADAFWDGAVSDVMIWNRTISADEVALLSGYKAGTKPFAICPAGLQCYYLCDVSAAVISTNACFIRNLAPTQNNALLFGQPITATYTTYPELVFTSSSLQYAQLPALAFNGTGFSFACILRSNNSAIGTPIFEFGNGINGSAFGVTIGTGVVTYYTTNGAGATVVSQNYTVSNLNNNTYNHFAITIGAISGTTSDVIVYWNGSVMGTNTLTYPINTPKLYGFVGTNYAKNAYLNGGIADVFIYTRPILQQEVTDLSGNVGGIVTTTSDTSQTTSVSGTITGLTKNAYYGFSVVATNDNGSSYASNAPIYTPNVPDPPTGLTAGTITYTSIQYTFTPPASLPYWYDVNVNGATVSYTGRLYPATCSAITVGTGIVDISGLATTSLGFAITAPGPVRLAIYLLNLANGLRAIRIINGVWGSSVILNVLYDIKPATATIINTGFAMTPDGRRCIITAGSSGNLDNLVYWADMTPVLNGTTSTVSFTRIAQTGAQMYSTVAVTNDGMRIAVSGYGGTGQEVQWAAWNGKNYGSLVTITMNTGVFNFMGTAFSADGDYLAYGNASSNLVYVTKWNGTTYLDTGGVSISGITSPSAIAFTPTAPYGIFISSSTTNNIYYSLWNGTGFSPATVISFFGTGVFCNALTIDFSNNLYVYPKLAGIVRHPLTYTLTPTNSNTATDLIESTSFETSTYTISMKSFGYYGYSQPTLFNQSMGIVPLSSYSTLNRPTTLIDSNTANQFYAKAIVSYTGKYILIPYSTSTSPYINISTNFGESFRMVANMNNTYIGMSWDGKVMYITSSGSGNVLFSTNYGVTFSAAVSYTRVGISGNGKYGLGYDITNLVVRRTTDFATWLSTTGLGTINNLSFFSLSYTGEVQLIVDNSTSTAFRITISRNYSNFTNAYTNNYTYMFRSAYITPTNGNVILSASNTTIQVGTYNQSTYVWTSVSLSNVGITNAISVDDTKILVLSSDSKTLYLSINSGSSFTTIYTTTNTIMDYTLSLSGTNIILVEVSSTGTSLFKWSNSSNFSSFSTITTNMVSYLNVIAACSISGNGKYSVVTNRTSASGNLSRALLGIGA